MANLTIRRDKNGGTTAPPTTAEWSPLRMMRSLLDWDPFREMAPAWMPEAGAFAPAFDVKESAQGFLFTADLPGVAESDLAVSLTENRLTISGKREAEHEEKGETFYSCERSYGSFSRAFTLPDGIDAEHIKAELKNGVLTIAVPKKPESQARRIAVKTESAKS